MGALITQHPISLLDSFLASKFPVRTLSFTYCSFLLIISNTGILNSFRTYRHAQVCPNSPTRTSACHSSCPSNREVYTGGLLELGVVVFLLLPLCGPLKTGLVAGGSLGTRLLMATMIIFVLAVGLVPQPECQWIWQWYAQTFTSPKAGLNYQEAYNHIVSSGSLLCGRHFLSTDS